MKLLNQYITLKRTVKIRKDILCLKNYLKQYFVIAEIIGNRLYNYEAIKEKIKKDSPKEEAYYDVLTKRHLLRFSSKLLVPEKLLNIMKNKLLDENKKLNKKDLIIKLANIFNVDTRLIEERYNFKKG